MSSREHEYQMRECVIMYSPGMLEVRDLWLTRLELDGGWGGGGREQSSWNETDRYNPPHPQLQLVPPWTLSPYLTLSIKPTLSLSVSLSHPLWRAPVVEPLRKSPSAWAREPNWRAKYYCTCCGGNNLKMNNAFRVPWATYVFSTFSPPSLFVKEVWGEAELA